jgi:hypothetical protein
MNGALPPSSSETRLTVCAAWAMSRRPTGVEPVKVTFLMTGCGIRYSLISDGTP